MDHFLFNTPRLLVGTKSDLRNNNKRIAELNANGQQLISIEQVCWNIDTKSNGGLHAKFFFFITIIIGWGTGKKNKHTIHWM